MYLGVAVPGQRGKQRAGARRWQNTEPLDAAMGQHIDAILQQLRNPKDVDASLVQVLDVAIGMTNADMGTLQRLDEGSDCLRIVASRGFSNEALSFFGIVRRDTNTTCAAALTQRMRVFVEDVSKSYLFVGTRELDVLRTLGIVAAQSTPLISNSGQLWGVLSVHFRKAQVESEFDCAQLDRLAVRVADSLERREGPVSSRHFHGRQVPDPSRSGE